MPILCGSNRAMKTRDSFNGGRRGGRTRRPAAQAAQVNPRSATERYKLRSSFQAVCTTLLEERFRDRWERPLDFWLLGTDRRLPLPLLGRSVRDLAESPFEQLTATPGIGLKKMRTLIALLLRASREQGVATDVGRTEAPDEKMVSRDGRSAARRFDPAGVSEVIWQQWQATVRQFGIDREKLGRLVPTLRSLPVSLWHTPLQVYGSKSVGEIRLMKTHGEKRVRTIVEVFGLVHEVLAGARQTGGLVIRLFPEFMARVELWIDQTVDKDELAPIDRLAVRKSLVAPLVDQVEHDLGPTVRELAEGQLGIKGKPQEIREQSRQFGVTRARIYQLLKECADMMAVRWPEGRHKLNTLHQRLESAPADAEALSLVRGVINLFFPADDVARTRKKPRRRSSDQLR
jgi:hypothetical protein